MFDQVGWGEMGVLLLLALFVFGPERLPGLAQDAGRALRKARLVLKGMTDDLKADLGPEMGDLAALHPKKFVESIFADEEPPSSVPPPSLARASVLPPGHPAPWDPDTT